MQTKEAATAEKINQKIQLVKGEFTAAEASDVILSLIEEKINFHKVRKLQQWEGNHRFETKLLDSRIDELREEKKVAKEFLDQMKSEGRSMKINGVLEITITD
jgi:RNA binding exosome subunit